MKKGEIRTYKPKSDNGFGQVYEELVTQWEYQNNGWENYNNIWT
jgi:hypothetical protein